MKFITTRIMSVDYTSDGLIDEKKIMNRFLLGFIIGVLITTAGYYFISSLPPIQNPNNLGRCSTGSEDCRPNPGRYRGISGMARLNADSHLVVHDSHDGPSQADINRLGIVKDTGKGVYSYFPISVGKDKWHPKGKVSNDLESACRLTHSNNEFLLAESGRVDKRVAGNTTKSTWHGRIFHVALANPDNKGTATVLVTPKLKLAKVTAPQFENPDPNSNDNEFPHSIENYEGMACIHLNKERDEPARYLVVLGERGGNKTLTGTLHWGEYDTAQNPAAREIKWHTSADIQNIVAPGKGRLSDAKWRDITGLHIDDQQRLFATAAFDTDDRNPPYQGVLYQLGVICINANDRHGKAALCDYTKPSRPALLNSFTILASSDHHKFESVAAASGQAPAKGQLSIGAEDEDSSGAWWPAIDN